MKGSYSLEDYRVCNSQRTVDLTESWQCDLSLFLEVLLRSCAHLFDKQFLVKQRVVCPKCAGRVVIILMVMAQITLSHRRIYSYTWTSSQKFIIVTILSNTHTDIVDIFINNDCAEQPTWNQPLLQMFWSQSVVLCEEPIQSHYWKMYQNF